MKNGTYNDDTKVQKICCSFHSDSLRVSPQQQQGFPFNMYPLWHLDFCEQQSCGLQNLSETVSVSSGQNGRDREDEFLFLIKRNSFGQKKNLRNFFWAEILNFLRWTFLSGKFAESLSINFSRHYHNHHHRHRHLLVVAKV